MRRPDFGGDMNVAPLDRRSADAVADFALIIVHFGGVDMAVAEPQSLLDDARANPAAQIPGAEPEQRNAGAIRAHRGDRSDRTHAPNLLPRKRAVPRVRRYVKSARL